MPSRGYIAGNRLDMKKKDLSEVNSVSLDHTSLSHTVHSTVGTDVLSDEGSVTKLRSYKIKSLSLKKLKSINNKINSRQYISDVDNNVGTPEYIYIPGGKHAIVKYFRFLEAGVSFKDMALVVGTKIAINTAQVVLVINYKNTKLYLDHNSEYLANESAYLNSFSPLYYDNHNLACRLFNVRQIIRKFRPCGQDTNHFITLKE